jgi:hypothetical protein
MHPDATARIDWSSLSHAYGPAFDIPALLLRAETDSRDGNEPGTAWFQLWSALCHQGDSYSASYAAVPALIRIAELEAYSDRYDPLLLAASIELARLEGRGPALSQSLAASYSEALRQGERLASQALRQSLNVDARTAFEGCVAAFGGDIEGARAIWDREDVNAV